MVFDKDSKNTQASRAHVHTHTCMHKRTHTSTLRLRYQPKRHPCMELVYRYTESLTQQYIDCFKCGSHIYTTQMLWMTESAGPMPQNMKSEVYIVAIQLVAKVVTSAKVKWAGRRYTP